MYAYYHNIGTNKLRLLLEARKKRSKVSNKSWISAQAVSSGALARLDSSIDFCGDFKEDQASGGVKTQGREGELSFTCKT